MSDYSDTKDCNECAGTGEVEQDYVERASFSNDYGFISTEWVICQECNGTGEQDD